MHVFFEIRFSAVKRGLPWVRLETRSLWIRITEWVLIPAAFSGVLAVLLYLSLSPLLVKDLEALPYGGIYERRDMGFSIPIYDQGWRRVAPGSFSDAGAIFEMRGPVEGSHGVIHYYAGADMNQRMHHRMLSMQRPLDSPICWLDDHGAPGGKGGLTHLFCSGDWGLDRVFHAASLIETEHGVYELVLFVSVSSRIISRYRTMIEKMTKGFDIMEAD